MKIKISNYIAARLVEAGICQAFMVTGGGAMHLNDGLGHQEGLHCIYNHHEQASAMAAEAYARIHNRIAALCVTTGPGGTNAITGVVGGWLDSIPMLVLSGQVRYDTTARWSGVGIRAMGDQEFDICKAIDCMTKYSEMVIDPMRIRYCLEKALYLARSGRPGPCWLDIPLNVQGAFVETEELPGFDAADYEAGGNGWAGKDGGHGIPEDEAGKGEHERRKQNDHREQNDQNGHHLRQRPGHGHQLHHLAFGGLGYFSWAFELGVCGLFCSALLTRRGRQDGKPGKEKENRF